MNIDNVIHNVNSLSRTVSRLQSQISELCFDIRTFELEIEKTNDTDTLHFMRQAESDLIGKIRALDETLTSTLRLGYGQ